MSNYDYEPKKNKNLPPLSGGVSPTPAVNQPVSGPPAPRQQIANPGPQFQQSGIAPIPSPRQQVTPTAPQFQQSGISAIPTPAAVQSPQPALAQLPLAKGAAGPAGSQGSRGSKGWFPDTGGVITDQEIITGVEESAAAAREAEMQRKQAEELKSTIPDAVTNPINPINTDESYEKTDMEKTRDEQIFNTLQGEGADVLAARESLKRDKPLILEKAKRDAHNRAVQAGYRPGTAQYEEIMRTSMSDAQSSIIDAENKVNQFARQTREGVWDEATSIGEQDYTRWQDENAKSDDNFETYMKYIPSVKGQQLAAANKASGGNIKEFYNSLWDDKGELVDWAKDKTDPARALDALNDRFKNVDKNPDTLKDWEPTGPNSKEEYLKTLWAEIQGNIVRPVGDEGDRITPTINTKNTVSDVIAGKANLDLGDKSFWSNLTTEQAQSLDKAGKLKVVDFNPAMTFKASNLPDGIKFDIATQVVHGKAGGSTTTTYNDLQAGEGKGSIVYSNNTPYQLIEYKRSKNDNWGTDTAAGFIRALNLKTGEEEELIPDEYFDL